jgi:regulator of protease activity HflC (stomatin/prohibitin superfamily)
MSAESAVKSSGSFKTVLLGVFVALFLMISIKMMFVNVDASDIAVIQSPISGELTVVTDPGWKWRGFGSCKMYDRRRHFSFSARKDQGSPVDESISTRFNDGGSGHISGTMNWSMPLDPKSIIRLHKDFHSIEAIEQQLIRPSLQKVIYNVGPTMSSTESSAERRSDIPKYMDDQIANGPYLMKTVQTTVKDPITGQDKQASVAQISLDEKGIPLRESKSQITEYGIQLQAVAIEAINYDEVVEKQIKERQNATTQVQISIANARKSEQDAISAVKKGEADAAKAKWEQETINAKEIALAEKDKRVAELSAQTAEQVKRKLILEGEGEAAKRQLVMNADGALDTKLKALVEINKNYAAAIGSYQGDWVPKVVMGNSGQAGAGSGAQTLVDMLSAKTARDLGIDLTVTKGNTTKK